MGATATARKALEASNAKLSSQVLKRLRLTKAKDSSQDELQKAQHQQELAKDMGKRQNNEIKELHTLIKELTAAVENMSASSVADHQLQASAPPGRPRAGRPVPG